MSKLVLFNKPYGVLTQFSSNEGRQTLADFIPVSGVYAAGRLDADSEGLVVLTDDGGLQARISNPRHKLAKRYLAQVEGETTDEALQLLAAGVNLGDFTTRPAEARRVMPPEGLWPRVPPIRFRKAIPTDWIELVLHEGKNRQVRRMTAKVGFPTLRLIRWSVGPWTLEGLSPGEWRFGEVPRQLAASPRVDVADSSKNRRVTATLHLHK